MEHNYWVEEGSPAGLLSRAPQGTRQVVVYLDPPGNQFGRRTATHLTLPEAGRLVRALQRFLIKEAFNGREAIQEGATE